MKGPSQNLLGFLFHDSSEGRNLAEEFGHSMAAKDKYFCSAFSIVISNLAEEFGHLSAAKDQKLCSSLPLIKHSNFQK